jgi:uncharacterized protein (TIGR03437 family)
MPRINAEILAPFYGPDSSVVQVIYNSAMLPDFRGQVDPSIFGIFLNPDGSAAAINQDGTLNSSSNPAKAGTIVSVWGTGFGNAAGTVNGAVTTVANKWCPSCQIEIGSPYETVVYAGAAPGLIDGVMQLNSTIPQQSGSTRLSVDFAGLANSVFVWVSP